MSRASDVMADVFAERAKQLAKWPTDHDDAHHTTGELVVAAAYLASPDTEVREGDLDDEDLGWAVHLKAKHVADRRKQLVVAAALILAEIERLDRLAERAQ